MSDAISKDERLALRALREAPSPHLIRFESWSHRGMKLETLNGVVVVTGNASLAITMESREWIARTRKPDVYRMTGVGLARAKRIRP